MCCLQYICKCGHGVVSIINFTTEDTTVSSHLVGHPWRIISAICVQRMPSLCRDKSDIEHRYEELKDTLRMERSRKSDFELEEEKHVAMKRERQKRALEEDLDMTQVRAYVV